ncbi:hypothetical protein Terro_3222 [Terriglobus roseus DSM 18391]|uniref:DUF885 domain-containing protein n=1 Tax=Terriglobus roseus (strain DSM 18391 / NRRL B-41598 / KBS 63) TaxID=926566 RepID=I3ZJM2_TERRK|nr:DUF885 domain-containing protein [Terriglobus roseus]AFL89440.1 hypothetical protein Terro_3222 [Terriglobus roseus DSM 18391]
MRLLTPVLCAALALPAIAYTQIAASPSAAAAPQDAASRSRALNKIFEDYWQFTLKSSPESATFFGDDRYNNIWSDYSASAFNTRLAREMDFLTQLGAIDTTGLPEQEQLSAQLLMRTFLDDQDGARFKQWQMPVSQFGGPHLDMLSTLNAMPFVTVKDYDNYIARLNKVPTVFSQAQEAMDAGITDGRTVPQMLMEKAQAQVVKIATTKPEESPWAAPLKKMPTSFSASDQKRIRTEAMEAITNQVLPSYDRFGRYLKAQYIPKARKTLAATALPDGQAYYAYLVRTNTTTTRTPDQIHQLGMEEVKRDEAEMLAIAKKQGFNDLKSFNASLKADPKQHATSADQLLDAFRKPLVEMQARLPEFFGRLPKAPFKVQATPAFREANSAPADYEPGTPDGKRAGVFNANTYHYADRPMYTAEAIAFHEGVPGHHLQISIAQELTGIPTFRKQGGYTAFQEGWGLYAERLGKDVGFYTNPNDDYGRLNADVWRAIRLVVDTGVHSKGWTRQQMVDFFHEHSAIDDSSIEAEVDRYIAIPSQALAYKSGQLMILELRERAKAKLGPKFNLKAFHDEVLDSGALPLDVLEHRVDAWIAAGGK